MIRFVSTVHAPWLTLLLGALLAACDGSGSEDSALSDSPPIGADADEGRDALPRLSGCTLPGYLRTSAQPIGWASVGQQTTGGGTTAPVLVKTLDALNAAAKGTSPAVIYVAGALTAGTATIGSNKTIIGCSGSGAALHGHVELKTSVNVIIRNVAIVGYNCAPPDVDVKAGGQCQNGEDAVTVDKASHHIWFDHDAISDGSDGNLDIVNGSDNVTVSYTKLFYSTARTDPNDTGAAGHRFSDLVGGSDSNGSTDSGHLNVTWHHDWWAQNVVERQPRVRFGKNHLFNDLWDSTATHYAIGVGVSANILDESNVFSGPKTAVDSTSYSNGASIVVSKNNIYGPATPPANKGGAAFTPPYAYAPEAANSVAADVRANAGPQ